MQKNSLTEIKNGLINYLGLAINSLSKDTSDVAKHKINALVLETLLDFSREEDGSYDPMVIRPFFRSYIAILRSKIDDLKQIDGHESIPTIVHSIAKYESLIESSKEFLSSQE